MGDRERGDDGHDLSHAQPRNDEAQQEQQVVDAAQDVVHPQLHEPRRRLPPRGIQRDPAGDRGKDQGRAVAVGADVSQRELDVIAQLRRKPRADRETRR